MEKHSIMLLNMKELMLIKDLFRSISNTMSSTLTQLVTVFNGSGYHAWADKMMAYLDFQGLSMIVNGDLIAPMVPALVTIAATATMAAHDNSNVIEAKQEKLDAWTIKDKQAR